MQKAGRITQVFCLALMGLCIGFQAQASPSGGILEGTITVTAPPRPVVGASSSAPSSIPSSKNYLKPTASNSHILPEEIVVYLEKVPGHFKVPKKYAVLDQKYVQFTHRVLPILVGTTVKFTNHDAIYHDVFSDCQANKSFDLGEMSEGQSGKVKFKHPEDVKVFCEIHSSMQAHILVLQNPYFAVVHPGEPYTLSHVPPGTYTLVVWHDYWAPVKMQVTVKKGQTTHQNATLSVVQ